MAEQRSRIQRTQEELESLSEEDRVWLAERLVGTKTSLNFLHAN